MFSEQLSVFIENRAGRLVEVTTILKNANINIRAISLADTTDFGVLRLIVDDNEKAENLLKEEGFTVGKTKIMAVEIKDEPGGLNQVLEPLAAEEINVEYMYPFTDHNYRNIIMIFRFDDHDKALDIFNRMHIKVVDIQAFH